MAYGKQPKRGTDDFFLYHNGLYFNNNEKQL